MIYRAKVKGVDTQEPRMVEGYWFKTRQGQHYIILDDVEVYSGQYDDYVDDFLDIDPTTLAMSTGIPDKHKVKIFGSFPVDGVMSRGGDRCKRGSVEMDIIWSGGGFMTHVKDCLIGGFVTDDGLEIIGTQLDKEVE